MKTNKSELVKVAKSYVNVAIKDYKLCKLPSNYFAYNNDDELFDSLTCEQIESTIALFKCLLYTEFTTGEVTNIVTLSDRVFKRISDFIYSNQSKDRFKFVVLEILDDAGYSFSDAINIIEHLKVNKISLCNLNYILKIFMAAYLSYKVMAEIEEKSEEIMTKHNIVFNQEVVKSMKDAAENNISEEEYKYSTIEYDLYTNSYKLNKSTKPKVDVPYYSPKGTYIKNNPSFILTVDKLMGSTEEEVCKMFYVHIRNKGEYYIESLFNAFKENSL